jgi:hypothetical protein
VSLLLVSCPDSHVTAKPCAVLVGDSRGFVVAVVFVVLVVVVLAWVVAVVVARVVSLTVVVDVVALVAVRGVRDGCGDVRSDGVIPTAMEIIHVAAAPAAAHTPT